MKGKILLLDDNRMDLEIATRSLERLGYDCHPTVDHTEAINWVRKNPVRMIFLDLELHHVTGYQLIPAFKNSPATAKTPIVIMSGRSQVANVTKAIKLGAVDYIIKPLSPRIIEEKMSRIDPPTLIPTFEVPEDFGGRSVAIDGLRVLAVSEFGMQIASAKTVAPGTMIELTDLPEHIFGGQPINVRCLASEYSEEAKRFVLKFAFTDLPAERRELIRESCR